MQRFSRVVRRLLLGAVLAAVLAAAAPARANDNNLPECHVLSVGVENYKAPLELPGCANDAKFLASRFQSQQGKLFSKVNAKVLVNNQATQQAIQAEMSHLTKQGKAGDWIVFIASGHNSDKGANWGFLTQDMKAISGYAILDLADAAASQGKKVLIVVDACYSGQFRLMAQNRLVRYDDPSKGGIVIMLAASPAQPSVAFVGLGYSPFSKAIDEALSGQADYNGDGAVTLQELRTYVYTRVYQQLQGTGKTQESIIEYSQSFSDGLVLAKTQPALLNVRDSLTKQDGKDTARTTSYRKVHTVTLQQGVRYVIDMRSVDMDSFLRLENANGTQVASDDDNGPGHRNARIVFTPTQTGTYRVIATTFSSDVTGGYGLSVRQAP
jgi:hypothetical protein